MGSAEVSRDEQLSRGGASTRRLSENAVQESVGSLNWEQGKSG